MTDDSSSNGTSYRTPSTSRLRADLREFTDALDSLPEQEMMDQEGPHSAKTYVNRYGSWRAALEDAGFDASALQPETAEADEGGPSPPQPEAGEDEGATESSIEAGPGHSIPSPCPVEWCDEVSPSRTARRTHLTSHPSDVVREALGRHLREVSEAIGHPPKRSEMFESEVTRFLPDTYSEWFESWTDALRFSGLPAWRNRRDEDYALALIRLAEQVGRPPTKDEMDEQGQYTSGGYITRFGSWSAALYLAELSKQDVSEAAWADFVEERESDSGGQSGAIDDDSASDPWGSSPPENLTREDRQLISDLRQFIKEFGELPTPTQLDLYGPAESHVYIERFGTWMRTLELAKGHPDR